LPSAEAKAVSQANRVATIQGIRRRRPR
jgi:hypothetical protein